MSSQSGYTLIEVLAVIIVLGILGGVAAGVHGPSVDQTRFDETIAEMDLLAQAIVGDPALVSGGTRSDYGYLGDVGALPPSWDALVTNPGGYATWRGPYVQDELAAGASNFEFKRDAWGKLYTAPTGLSFSSTGGPDAITRSLAASMTHLLSNSASFVVLDLSLTPPGTGNMNSVRFLLTYPDGAGALTTASRIPDANGYVRFESLPIGLHTLKVVFLPQNDTLIRRVNIDPGHDYYAEVQYHAPIW